MTGRDICSGDIDGHIGAPGANVNKLDPDLGRLEQPFNVAEVFAFGIASADNNDVAPGLGTACHAVCLCCHVLRVLSLRSTLLLRSLPIHR